MIEGRQKILAMGQGSGCGKGIRLFLQPLNLFNQSLQVSKQTFLGATQEHFGLLFPLLESRCLQKKVRIANHPISNLLRRLLITIEEKIQIPTA